MALYSVVMKNTFSYRDYVECAERRQKKIVFQFPHNNKYVTFHSTCTPIWDGKLHMSLRSTTNRETVRIVCIDAIVVNYVLAMRTYCFFLF